MLYLSHLRFTFALIVKLSLIIVIAQLMACTISNTTTYEDTEGRIPENFFTDIRHGTTTQLWVESQLGEPQTQQRGEGTQLISNYRLYRQHRMHADLLFVLRYDGKEQDVEYLHIFYEDGVVKRYWRDTYPKAQSSRYFKKPKADTPPENENPSPEMEQSTPPASDDDVEMLIPQPLMEHSGVHL